MDNKTTPSAVGLRSVERHVRGLGGRPSVVDDVAGNAGRPRPKNSRSPDAQPIYSLRDFPHWAHLSCHREPKKTPILPELHHAQIPNTYDTPHAYGYSSMASLPRRRLAGWRQHATASESNCLSRLKSC